MELKTEPINDEYATPLLSKDWSENPGKPLSSSSSQASFQDPTRTHDRVIDPQQQQQLLLNPGQLITSQKSPLHNSDSDTLLSSNQSSSSISSHNFDIKLPKMTVSETPPEAITSTRANGTNGSEHKDPSNVTSALLCKSSASARQIYQGPEFPVGPLELSALAEEHGHTRGAIASLLLDGAKFHKSDGYTDRAYVLEKCAERLSDDEEKKGAVDMDEAAELLARDLLYTDPIKGIDTTGSGGGDSGDHHIEYRKHVFGTNAIAAKEFDSFLRLCWDALQDFVLIMLIVLGVISIVVETTIGNEADHCTTCWIEGAAILTSVCIVTLVTAGIDYAKQGAFARLSQALNDRNMKLVTRNGKQIEVIDADIVVGDILNVNSHNLASIPADCILLGPASEPLKMNESSLTGESVPVSKLPGDVILSGTNAVEGSGRMVVIAVGTSSVAGKIKARVYADGAGDELDADEDSPLTQKLELIAKHIGIIGTVAAVVAFGASTILGLAVEGEDVENLVDYFIVAITVLAVAVPEGLPLAVTLALAFSSNKMMSEQNLVKHLESCETMGCATTICTDKTGTLTANRMTARAVYTDQQDFSPTEASQTLGDHVTARGLAKESISLIAKCISIDTMNETTLNEVDSSGNVNGGIGNPTEVALLTFVHELGYSYTSIRDSTPGRSTSAQLKEQLSRGKQLNFSSARKMMSWVVPKTGGGYRVYTKGASEVILERCNSVHLSFVSDSFEESVLGIRGAIEAYARRGMRTLALAYRELPEGADLEAVSSSVSNSDGTPALKVETELTFLALIGIEDPLRPEVPPAIEKCYKAGIDVRMVTGDSPNTAVSIAYQAGILRDEHFIADERVAENLRENVLMEGKDFRSKVYRTTSDGLKEFDQGAFDKIWPHLRVLARSSPDDKLTLAHGLNQSTLYEDKSKCKELKRDFDIRIFPDRQVVAMTGDGTNDAPALKRADIGFAMGIAGTQIAKDAADIILLDDNFASIVVAAKWGRNIYASIQKFLQFQLTVNIAAVVTALVGAFAYQQSPLAAIQLLWVNLIMDALASLALASEKPIDSLLEADPVNRSDSMITERMWFNMIGQAGYQLIVTMILLFEGPDIWGYEAGDIVEQDDSKYDDYVGEPSEHYTMIFNTFVWMQLFNEINSRHLHGEINVFKGLSSNSLFIGIWVGTAALQVLMISFFSHAMRVKEGGLPADIWGWCLLFGVGSIPMQQLINAVYSITRNYGPLRKRRKQQSIRDLSVRSMS